MKYICIEKKYMDLNDENLRIASHDISIYG